MVEKKRATRPWILSRASDNWFRLIVLAFALLTVLILAQMAATVGEKSRESISHFGLSFITGREWNPLADQFGALPFIYGTLVTSVLAILVAGPIGLGVGIFLSELAPVWLRAPVSFMIELLAAIPSIVYGMWGIFVLAPWLRRVVQPWLSDYFGFLPLFQGPALGVGFLAAGLILAIMVLPTITAVSREVLRAVPDHQREAALALGATRWEMIRLAVLPPARSGILGAVMLAFGRALGETMAVTMLIGNRPEIKTSLFAAGYSMSSVLANEFLEAVTSLHLSAMMEIALLLFGVTLLMNILARLLIWSVERQVGARVS